MNGDHYDRRLPLGQSCVWTVHVKQAALRTGRH